MSIALRLLTEQEQAAQPKKNWEKQAFLAENEPAPEAIRDARIGGTERRILVADDNPVVLKAFEMKLKAEGFVVTTTPNAASVVAIAETAKVDLIILDVNFPAGGQEWSGFTVMHWLKRFPELGRIPVIVITGSDSARYREEAAAAGAAAFFQKPVKYSELHAAILRALSSRSDKA